MKGSKQIIFRRALPILLCLVLVLSVTLTFSLSANAAVSEWAAGTSYVKGDIVSYQSKYYECLQPHTALQGWEPANVASLWKVYDGPITVNTPTNTPTPTASASNPVTGFKVSGYVSADIRDGFKFELVGTAKSAVSNANGYYEMTGVPSNTSGYSGKVSKTGFLTRTITNIPGNGNVSIGSVTAVDVWAGDINQDGVINMADIMELSKCFNSVPGDGKYNADVDFNKDNAVNMADVMIVVKHFNKTTVDYAVVTDIIVLVPSYTNTSTPTNTLKPTNTPTPTPTHPINTGLPKRIMVGYWHTWGGNNPFIKLRDVDPNWDVINIAFSEPVSPGSGDGRMKFVVSGLSTVSGYTIDDFKADIKLLQSQGKKVVLSIGGYEGWFYLGSTGAVSQFVNDIKGFVNEYGFDGIDIDLEQDSIMFNQGNDPYFKNPTSPRIVNMISALRQIMNSYGPNFMLTWAPETFYLQNGIQYYAGIHQYCLAKAGCYIPLIHALRDKTTYVHAQLYNSTPMMGNDGKLYNMGTVDGIVAMCDMVLSGFKIMGKDGDDYFFPPLRPDQVVIGVPASASAANSGQISNAQLQQAFSTVNSKYPNLRGIMTWSINWDSFQNNNSFVKENGAFLDRLN